MTMIVNRVKGIDLVNNWIHLNREHGKTDTEMAGTTFIFGNEVITLYQSVFGGLKMESKSGPVVVFRQLIEEIYPNVCRACGMEHDNHKDAVVCCTKTED